MPAGGYARGGRRGERTKEEWLKIRTLNKIEKIRIYLNAKFINSVCVYVCVCVCVFINGSPVASHPLPLEGGAWEGVRIKKKK